MCVKKEKTVNYSKFIKSNQLFIFLIWSKPNFSIYTVWPKVAFLLNIEIGVPATWPHNLNTQTFRKNRKELSDFKQGTVISALLDLPRSTVRLYRGVEAPKSNRLLSH